MKLKEISELAYEGNMGIEEIFLFFRKANSEQKKRMHKIIDSGSWSKYKDIIKEVLNVELK